MVCKAWPRFKNSHFLTRMGYREMCFGLENTSKEILFSGTKFDLSSSYGSGVIKKMLLRGRFYTQKVNTKMLFFEYEKHNLHTIRMIPHFIVITSLKHEMPIGNKFLTTSNLLETLFKNKHWLYHRWEHIHGGFTS